MWKVKYIEFFFSGFWVSIILIGALGCEPTTQKENPVMEREVPMLWADITLYITKNTPANSPTFASRALGYSGVTMYESIVNGFKGQQSLAGQLTGLQMLPVPEENKKYNWVLSLNAGQALILKSIYIQTSDENKLKIDSLENLIQTIFSQNEDADVIARSIAYGREVAAEIFEWSKSDGGHRGYLNNFDNDIQYPSKPGSWKPPFFAQTISRFPLHPHWGNNRTFVPADQGWKTPDFLDHDSATTSDSHKGFLAVYNSNRNLTQEQKEIALWWNDDPSETYTPPGHSLNLASLTLRKTQPEFIKCAETYARVGLAVADAFIVCWKMKYFYFSERPSTFINENVDDEWEPFWPDPPFPSFPSGHATQAAAVATVLTDLFGDNFKFEDNTHLGRPKDKRRNVEYKTRTFNSFAEVATETAYSRFLGGIHTAQDNDVGLQEGSKVGANVNTLKWRR